MGNLIKATCTHCDFEKDFNFGGNMMDFTTNNPVAAIHKISGKFRNVNYFISKLKDNYTYYFEDSLKGNNKNGPIYENFELTLNEHNNFCPECKNTSLEFILKAFTD
ncbi:hypothetical protein [Polaribacter marinivivus]|uniref:hypothetical protein n=1 Tax=Polaribacter marinivivus TaxID=1524260 RepID=UPI003D340A1A